MSDAGRRLVNRICDAVEERERSVQVRKYARGPNMRIKFEKAIGAFVADVLRARQSARADGWLSRSLRNDSFPAGGEFSWTTANHAVQGLQQLGLLEVVKGYTAFGTPSTPGLRKAISRHVPSKLRACPALIALATECGVPVDRANLHFTAGPPKDPVVVRATSTWDGYTKIRGTVMRTLPVPERITAEVHEINQFLRNFTLEGGNHEGFFRGFNNGDSPNFEFDQGGRLYSAGDETYQSMKPDARLALRINGAPVVEVDVRASFLTIAYALHHLPRSEDDPYVIEGLGLDARTAVKMFVAATIGSGKPITKWSKRHQDRYHDDTGQTLKRWPLDVVAAGALARHPFLANLGQRTASGLIAGWSTLMWIESEAIVATALDLLRNYKIPAYPVHDSLIVAAHDAERTLKQMRAHYLGKLKDYHGDAQPPEVRIAGR